MPSLFYLKPIIFHCGATLSSPYSCSDFPLFLQVATDVYLDNLVIWTNGPVSFPFGKGGSGLFANCSLCSTEATVPFSADLVFSSFSAKISTILQALPWFWQHQQVCHFSFLLLLSISRSVLVTLPSPTPFLLPQTLWQKLSSPLASTLLLGYNRSPQTYFSRETTRLMSRPDG